MIKLAKQPTKEEALVLVFLFEFRKFRGRDPSDNDYKDYFGNSKHKQFLDSLVKKGAITRDGERLVIQFKMKCSVDTRMQPLPSNNALLERLLRLVDDWLKDHEKSESLLRENFNVIGNGLAGNFNDEMTFRFLETLDNFELCRNADRHKRFEELWEFVDQALVWRADFELGYTLNHLRNSLGSEVRIQSAELFHDINERLLQSINLIRQPFSGLQSRILLLLNNDITNQSDHDYLDTQVESILVRHGISVTKAVGLSFAQKRNILFYDWNTTENLSDHQIRDRWRQDFKTGVAAGKSGRELVHTSKRRGRTLLDKLAT